MRENVIWSPDSGNFLLIPFLLEYPWVEYALCMRN